jgi:hypothetical protein
VRAILLLLLLTVAACSMREETFAPGEETTPAGLSLTPRNPNIPLNQDGDLACPGGFAKGSRIDEYRDGSANLFCD